MVGDRAPAPWVCTDQNGLWDPHQRGRETLENRRWNAVGGVRRDHPEKPGLAIYRAPAVCRAPTDPTDSPEKSFTRPHSGRETEAQRSDSRSRSGLRGRCLTGGGCPRRLRAGGGRMGAGARAGSCAAHRGWSPVPGGPRPAASWFRQRARGFGSHVSGQKEMWPGQVAPIPHGLCLH